MRATTSGRDAGSVHVWAPGFSSEAGGIAAFSRELAIALATGGWAPELWAKDDRDGTVDGARRHGTGAVPRRLRAPAFAAGAFAAAVRSPPARIITTHANFAPVAALARRARGIPYTIVAHGIDIHASLTTARAQALRNADAVWAVSRWSRQRCLERGVPQGVIGVVGNTVDAARFTPGGRDPGLLERYGIAAGEKVLLTVARLDAAEGYKGYDRVVQALPALREAVGPVRYLLVGRGDDRARIERLASECGVADAVTFCGFVADEALAAHYRLADAFAMPSRAEGFGIVFLEAMACGVPVLGGDRDGTADALLDGALGELVDPDDAAAVAAGLGRLLRGEGAPHWHDPAALRAACLRHHGRAAFAQRVAGLMASRTQGAPACAA